MFCHVTCGAKVTGTDIRHMSAFNISLTFSHVQVTTPSNLSIYLCVFLSLPLFLFFSLNAVVEKKIIEIEIILNDLIART